MSLNNIPHLAYEDLPSNPFTLIILIIKKGFLTNLNFTL